MPLAHHDLAQLSRDGILRVELGIHVAFGQAPNFHKPARHCAKLIQTESVLVQPYSRPHALPNIERGLLLILCLFEALNPDQLVLQNFQLLHHHSLSGDLLWLLPTHLSSKEFFNDEKVLPICCLLSQTICSKMLFRLDLNMLRIFGLIALYGQGFALLTQVMSNVLITVR